MNIETPVRYLLVSTDLQYCTFMLFISLDHMLARIPDTLHFTRTVPQFLNFFLLPFLNLLTAVLLK
jgi:hypothetical protein